MSAKDAFTWNVTARIENGQVSEVQFEPVEDIDPPSENKYASVPSFTSHHPYPQTTEWHNHHSGHPLTQEGILKALADLKALPDEDLDPPSYLPIREQLPPRIPDLCPDDTYLAFPNLASARVIPSKPCTSCGDNEMARKRCESCDGTGFVPGDDCEEGNR